MFHTQHFQWWSFRSFGSFHLIELWLFGTLVGNFMTGCWIVVWARYAIYSVDCVGSRGPNEFVRINQALLIFPKVYAPTQWCSCSAKARVQKTDWQYVSFPCESFPPLPLSYCSPFQFAHTSLQPFSVHPVSRQVSAELSPADSKIIWSAQRSLIVTQPSCQQLLIDFLNYCLDFFHFGYCREAGNLHPAGVKYLCGTRLFMAAAGKALAASCSWPGGCSRELGNTVVVEWVDLG